MNFWSLEDETVIFLQAYEHYSKLLFDQLPLLV
jgi:hypothetical protein